MKSYYPLDSEGIYVALSYYDTPNITLISATNAAELDLLEIAPAKKRKKRIFLETNPKIIHLKYLNLIFLRTDTNPGTLALNSSRPEAVLKVTQTIYNIELQIVCKMSLLKASILVIDDDVDVLTAVRLLLKTEVPQNWLKPYFNKEKLARKSMFNKYSWFGIPLN